jgi:hypothetical protein
MDQQETDKIKEATTIVEQDNYSCWCCDPRREAYPERKLKRHTTINGKGKVARLKKK